MGVDKFYVYDGRVNTLNCDLRRYVFQDLNYPIAEFVSNQLSDVLYIGNTPTNPLNGTTGFIGINTNTPNVELTVNGSISSNSVIYASGGNSDIWNRSAIMQVTSIGDGVNSSFVYYHNFGSRDVITQIYDNTSYNVVYPLVSNTTIDSITIFSISVFISGRDSPISTFIFKREFFNSSWAFCSSLMLCVFASNAWVVSFAEFSLTLIF
jgi:hypothetical protein